MEKLKQAWQKTKRVLNKAIFDEEIVAYLGGVSSVYPESDARQTGITFKLVRRYGSLYVKYSFGWGDQPPGYISLSEVKALQSILDKAQEKAKDMEQC